MPSDDNFTVNIANFTNNALNPGTSSFQYGDFGSNPASIPPNTDPAIEAFEVQGKVADGPQGTVNYNIDNNVQAYFEFNNNVGGNNGNDYFFAGLQPQQSGDDCSGYYLQITGFSMPAPLGDTSFTLTVNVYPNDGSNYNVTPIQAPTISGNGYVYLIYVINATGQLMTLNQLAAPLNAYLTDGYDSEFPFQPYVATTLVPETGGQTQLMAAAACVVGAPEDDVNLQVSYNLAGGAIININYDWQANTTPVISMTGSNTSKYQFSSTQANQQYINGQNYYFLTQLTITVELAS